MARQNASFSGQILLLESGIVQKEIVKYPLVQNVTAWHSNLLRIAYILHKVENIGYPVKIEFIVQS